MKTRAFIGFSLGLALAVTAPVSASGAALEATTQYKEGFKAMHGWLIGAPQGWARRSCLDLISSAGSG